MSDDSTFQLDRRRLLGCTALLGLTGPLLVSCGSDDAGEATPAPDDDGSATPDESDSATGGAALVSVDEVPVGGGVVLADEQVIVTQPSEGEFKGYTTVCPHQGGAVTSVGKRRMTCSLHGSQFAIEDGANLVGPNGGEAGSTGPLPEVPVAVEGGQVVKA